MNPVPAASAAPSAVRRSRRRLSLAAAVLATTTALATVTMTAHAAVRGLHLEALSHLEAATECPVSLQDPPHLAVGLLRLVHQLDRPADDLQNRPPCRLPASPPRRQAGQRLRRSVAAAPAAPRLPPER